MQVRLSRCPYLSVCNWSQISPFLLARSINMHGEWRWNNLDPCLSSHHFCTFCSNPSFGGRNDSVVVSIVRLHWTVKTNEEDGSEGWDVWPGKRTSMRLPSPKLVIPIRSAMLLTRHLRWKKGTVLLLVKWSPWRIIPHPLSTKHIAPFQLILHLFIIIFFIINGTREWQRLPISTIMNRFRCSCLHRGL